MGLENSDEHSFGRVGDRLADRGRHLEQDRADPPGVGVDGHDASAGRPIGWRGRRCPGAHRAHWSRRIRSRSTAAPWIGIRVAPASDVTPGPTGVVHAVTAARGRVVEVEREQVPVRATMTGRWRPGRPGRARARASARRDGAGGRERRDVDALRRNQVRRLPGIARGIGRDVGEGPPVRADRRIGPRTEVAHRTTVDGHAEDLVTAGARQPPKEASPTRSTRCRRAPPTHWGGPGRKWRRQKPACARSGRSSSRRRRGVPSPSTPRSGAALPPRQRGVGPRPAPPIRAGVPMATATTARARRVPRRPQRREGRRPRPSTGAGGVAAPP